ncbi:MAG: hypothetical protein LBS27_11840 [Bifidobacteriaceae bacterium]|jgi:hypothetical protein|nr:hypothetical protein [Bifidobacteriaceae bacterium]
MTTTLARHTVTETPDVAAALDVAADLWPEQADRRGLLARRLILAGAEALEPEREAKMAARRRLVDEIAGCFTGVYGPDEAARLKDEWPE